jgi:hypothetical protein
MNSSSAAVLVDLEVSSIGFEASDVSPEARMMIRAIGYDIIAKHGKPLRLINWTRVLKVSPPKLTILQDAD